MNEEVKAKHLLLGSKCSNCIYCGAEPNKISCVLSQSSIGKNRIFIHENFCSFYLSDKLMKNENFHSKVYSNLKNFGNLENVVKEMETYRGIS